MAAVNEKFVREELQAAEEQLEALRQSGKVSPEADALFRILLPLLTLLVAVLLEKTTRKTSRNSSMPPSQTDADDTAQPAGPARRTAKANDRTSSNLQQVTFQETVPVTACDDCGADLSAVPATGRERRVLYDIVFRVIEQRVAAEIKQCPDCQARSKGRFPANLPGPRQYGVGLQAFISNLLVAHMLSLRRVVELVRAISGLVLVGRPPASATSAACTSHCRLGRRPPAPACWTRRPCMPTKPACGSTAKTSGCISSPTGR